MQIDTGRHYQVEVKTGRGNIVLELYPEHAPKTVNNFVFLAGQGFYDGTTFHRVIDGFMVQGGDPTGTGRGSTMQKLYPWRMRGRTPTAASSSLPMRRSPTSTASTPSSAR
jgi:peptidyl-prolyl cis-trans isomerase B (cyclophilin B)